MEMLTTIKHVARSLIKNWMEPVQYSPSLTITGAQRGGSREKLYHELSFESFDCRKWYQNICCFFEESITPSPKDLFEVVPTTKRVYIISNDGISSFQSKIKIFQQL